MSNQVFPTLIGQGWSIIRTIRWSTRKYEAISGKETALSDWSAPRYEWEITFDLLRQGNIYGTAWTEMQQLFGFFNARNGGADTFQFQDNVDNQVTGQSIGTGDGSTTAFQLVRAFGGFVEPVFAPNVVSHVYRNGVDHSDWTISNWGTSTPGIITFSPAPALSDVITADFSYYWPVRFKADDCQFEQFMTGRFTVKKLVLESIKGM